MDDVEFVEAATPAGDPVPGATCCGAFGSGSVGGTVVPLAHSATVGGAVASRCSAFFGDGLRPPNVSDMADRYLSYAAKSFESSGTLFCSVTRQS